MNTKYLVIFYTIICCFSFSRTLAQATNNFELGAQVFIEPGQTQQETEQWFKILKENGMNVCRIRMFESYYTRLMAVGILVYLTKHFC